MSDMLTFPQGFAPQPTYPDEMMQHRDGVPFWDCYPPLIHKCSVQTRIHLDADGNRFVDRCQCGRVLNG